MSFRRLGLVALLVAVLSVAGFGGTASAQGYNGGPTITVTPTVILPCQSGTVTGSGFPPNTAGTVTVAGTTYPVTSDASGNWSVTITVPCSATAGTQLEVIAAFGTVSATAVVTVGSSSGTTGTTLPVTGSGDTTALLARAGVLLVLAGGAIVMVSSSRRRRSTASA